MRIVVLPTLDYEIYHGRNFARVEQVLFEPTQRVLLRAHDAAVPFTLFADVCSVNAHRMHGLNGFVEGFEKQLRDAVSLGHDVQLHLHPHWLAATYRGGEWNLKESKMTLAELDYGTTGPADIIHDGAVYLERLLRPLRPEYRCVAFRAGGLALAPKQDAVFAALAQNGIFIDSSVAKDYAISNDVLTIDYRDTPASANWRAGDIFEIPIGTFRMPVSARLKFLTRRVAAAGSPRRGAPVSRTEHQTALRNAATLVRQNMRYLSSSVVFLFSADTKGYTRKMLVDGFKQHVRRHAETSAGAMFVSMLNHPKLLYKSEENLLFDVLEELRDAYGGALTFATYMQVARSLEEDRRHLHL